MISFHCEKTLLQNAINLTGRAVSPKSSIPALEGLLLQAADNITLSGYNMSTGIRSSFPADVREPGRVVFSARLFGDIVRRMPDDVVNVTVNDNLIVRLTCGDADFEISGMDAADFPELPVVEEDASLTIRQDLFRAMIDQTVFSVSTNEARPIHTGALFETEGGRLTMVAVDGFRLALRREELASANAAMSFVTPGAALNEVKNICADTDETAVITPGKRHILFEIGDTELICRRLEGEFLNYRKTVPFEFPVKLKADKSDMIRCADRVSLIIDDRTKNPLRCTFGDGKLSITCATPLGRAEDACQMEGSGGDMVIGFNNIYLLDALKAAPGDRICVNLISGSSPCVITPEDGSEKFLYMILPVRLRAGE